MVEVVLAVVTEAHLFLANAVPKRIRHTKKPREGGALVDGFFRFLIHLIEVQVKLAQTVYAQEATNNP